MHRATPTLSNLSPRPPEIQALRHQNAHIPLLRLPPEILSHIVTTGLPSPESSWEDIPEQRRQWTQSDYEEFRHCFSATSARLRQFMLAFSKCWTSVTIVLKSSDANLAESFDVILQRSKAQKFDLVLRSAGTGVTAEQEPRLCATFAAHAHRCRSIDSQRTIVESFDPVRLLAGCSLRSLEHLRVHSQYRDSAENDPELPPSGEILASLIVENPLRSLTLLLGDHRVNTNPIPRHFPIGSLDRLVLDCVDARTLVQIIRQTPRLEHLH